jgi:hypothetical protein
MSQGSVTVCRGCCCGREDPAAAEALLQSLVNSLPGHLIRKTDCLGPCERKDVIVVSPSVKARQRGARPVWLGWMRDDTSMRELVDWVVAGGPGDAPMPSGLDLHIFRASRKVRRKAG